MVISEGTIGDTLYIVSEGSAEVVVNLETDHEKVLATLRQGDIVGEMSLIESVARTASVRAIEEPTILYALHKSDLHRLFKRMPQQFSLLILNIARIICRRLRTILRSNRTSKSDRKLRWSVKGFFKIVLIFCLEGVAV